MTMVDWKGVGLIEFPEDMSQEDINQRLSDQEFYFDEQFGIPSDPGFWAEIMPDAVERGFRKTVMGVQAARSLNPDLPIIGLSNEEAAIAIREQKARINDIPMSAETSAVLQDVMDQDFFEAVGTMIVNPGAAASIIGEGLGGSVPAAAATIAAVAVPSLMGLALGPLGVIAAGGTAAGTTSFATEYANTLIDHMMDDGGVDVMDVDEVAAALSNEELMAEAKESAVARGIPVGFVDAAAFALGGVFSNFVKAGRGGAKAGIEVGEDSIKVAPTEQIANPRSRAFELAGMTSMETAGGIGGEALAQLSDEGAINRPGELAIEGLAQGLIGGPTNLVSYLSAEYAARKKAGDKLETDVSNLPAEQVVDTEAISINSINESVKAEKNIGVTSSNEYLNKLQEKITKREDRIRALEEEAAAGDTTPERANTILTKKIPQLKAKLAQEKPMLRYLADLNEDYTFIDESADRGFGYGRLPHQMELSRRPTKIDPDSIWGSLSSLFSRSTAAVEGAAQNPDSPNAPVIRNMLNTTKGFFYDVKIIKGQRINELNKIIEPFRMEFRIPGLSSLRESGRGSGAYGVNRNISKAMTKALKGDLTPDNLRAVMDKNNIPENLRPAFVNSVQQARAMLDDMQQSAEQSGVGVGYEKNYVKVDMSPLFGNSRNARKLRERAIKALIQRKVLSEKQAKNLFDRMQDGYRSNKAASSDLSELIKYGVIPEPTRQQTFQKARTLLPKVREVLIEEDIVPTDFYEVMRRYIGQHAIAIPTASRIKPVRQQIAAMQKTGKLSREDDFALGKLLDVTRAVEGKYGTGASGMSRGARTALSTLISAMYIITLGMAGVASLGEVMVMTAHSKPGDVLYKGGKKMLHVMSRKFARSFKPNLKKSEVEEGLEVFIYVSAPELAERYTSQSVVDFSTKATEKFFLLNLLTQITQATRIMAAGAFESAIDRDVSILKTADKNSKEYRQAMMRMRKLGVPENRVTSMTPEMRQMAILSGIDQTVMTPDPTNRPLWMSNPYLAPIAMLKSFATVFGNTIGKMVWDEVVVGQTSYGEKLTKGERAAKALRYATMLSLLMSAQMVIELFRDQIRNWDDEDQDYDDATSFEFLMESGKNTMIFGLATPILDAFSAQKYGKTFTGSLLGPIPDKVDRLVRAASVAATEGEIKLLVREFLRNTPLIAVNPGARRSLEEGILEELNSILD